MTTVKYHKIKNFSYKTRRGLSEKQIKKKLQDQGWIIWRGAYIPRKEDLEDRYPNVKKHYEKLIDWLEEDFDYMDELRYLSQVHHGMPDFICYHPALKQWKYVECKLENEQPSIRQLCTIARLESMGFIVELHKLSSSRRTRGRMNGTKVKVLEQEKKITSYT
jgi:hypothetical protein